jgi:hypothetical protein
MDAPDCSILAGVELRINPEDGKDDHWFECEVPNSGLSLPIIANLAQTKKLKSMLEEGTLKSGVSTLVLNPNVQTDGKSIFLPNDLEIVIGNKQQNSNKSQRKLQGDVFGDKPLLVVRVVDSQNRAVPESVTGVSNEVFGNGVDSINLKTQISACSFNKLTIQPAETVGTYNGIDVPSKVQPFASGTIEVQIPVDLTTVANRYEAKDATTVAVQNYLGFSLPGPFEQVMYVYEKCYVDCGWAAYAYINSWNSVFQGVYYKHAAVQMHEFGHNFGLAHSGGIDGQTYTDHTCSMGNPLYGDDLGLMCFNPAKNWQLGWYNDAKILIDPRQKKSSQIKVIGLADYDKRTDLNDPVTVKIETGTTTDIFVGFNLAKGINAQNDEADDEVTVVETGNNGESYSQSYLKATLLQGERYTYVNWQGTGQDLTIEAVTVDKNAVPGYAIVNICLGGCMTAPTSSPTKAPTKNPTSSPSASPSKSRSPTKAPVAIVCSALDKLQCQSYTSQCSWSGKNKVCYSSNPAPSPVTSPVSSPVSSPTNPPNCGQLFSKSDCQTAGCRWFKGSCV